MDDSVLHLQRKMKGYIESTTFCLAGVHGFCSYYGIYIPADGFLLTTLGIFWHRDERATVCTKLNMYLSCTSLPFIPPGTAR
jgi:hypothetical protein